MGSSRGGRRSGPDPAQQVSSCLPPGVRDRGAVPEKLRESMGWGENPTIRGGGRMHLARRQPPRGWGGRPARLGPPRYWGPAPSRASHEQHVERRRHHRWVRGPGGAAAGAAGAVGAGLGAGGGGRGRRVPPRVGAPGAGRSRRGWRRSGPRCAGQG